MPLETLAKTLILAALALLGAGILLYAFARLGLPRLPGDLVFEGRNWKVVFPLATSILLSLLLTLLLNLAIRFFR
jgi:hypothetical protein